MVRTETVSPYIIRKVQQNARVVDKARKRVIEAPLSTAAEINGEIQQIWKECGFTPTPRQTRTLDVSLPVFAEHKAASKEATEIAHDQPDVLKQLVANHLCCSPSAIAIVHHPTSISVFLTEPVFAVHNQMRLRRDGVEASTLPLGFTATHYVIDINGKRLPYSILNRDTASPALAMHERDHQEREYGRTGHLRTKEKRRSTEAYRKELTGAARSAVEQNDRDTFRNDVRHLTAEHLDSYLGELSAYATHGVTDVYGRFFQSPEGSYSAYFNQNIAAVRRGLPNDPYDAYDWERIIFEELRRMHHKMEFIDAGGRRLDGLRKQQIADRIKMLTPNRGYLIKAFEPYPECTNLRSWIRKYHYGADLHSRWFTIDFWEYFIKVRTGICKAEYNLAHDSVDHLLDTAFSLNKQPALLDLNQHYATRQLQFAVVQVAKERVRRLQGFLNSGISNVEGDRALVNKAQKRVVRSAIDFNDEFYHAFDSRGIVHDEIGRQALLLDSISEEVAEMFANGQRVDYRVMKRLFDRDYQKVDWKQERILRSFEEMDNRRVACSPFENEVINQYKELLSEEQWVELHPRDKKPGSEAKRKVASAVLRVLL